MRADVVRADVVRADKEMTFLEHLGELRTRMLRSMLYLVLGATAGWYTFNFVNRILIQPAVHVFAERGIKFFFPNFWGPFTLRFQVAVIVGLIYALPLITHELWGFIEPALLPHERKWVHFVAPLSVIFFLLGVLSGYLVMKPAIIWFLGYLPPGETILQNSLDFILFELKCVLAFGVVFELPVVLMFLAMVGFINSTLLKKQWRYAVLILSVVAAVVTPSNDPATMMAMCVPLIILYGISIFLVQVTEKMCGRTPPRGGLPPSNPVRSG